MTAIERERAEYGLKTLKHLHDQLKEQFKKYPQTLSWIKWEIEKQETLLGNK